MGDPGSINRIHLTCLGAASKDVAPIHIPVNITATC